MVRRVARTRKELARKYHCAVYDTPVRCSQYFDRAHTYMIGHRTRYSSRVFSPLRFRRDVFRQGACMRLHVDILGQSRQLMPRKKGIGSGTSAFHRQRTDALRFISVLPPSSIQTLPLDLPDRRLSSRRSVQSSRSRSGMDDASDVVEILSQIAHATVAHGQDAWNSRKQHRSLEAQLPKR